MTSEIQNEKISLVAIIATLGVGLFYNPGPTFWLFLIVLIAVITVVIPVVFKISIFG